MHTVSKHQLFGKAKHHYQDVKDLIRYCSLDQPFDRSEVIWLYGQKRKLVDLFRAYNIPEIYHAEIAASIGHFGMDRGAQHAHAEQRHEAEHEERSCSRAEQSVIEADDRNDP